MTTVMRTLSTSTRRVEAARGGILGPLLSLVLGWAALSFLIGGLEVLPAFHVAFHGLWGPHRHGATEPVRAAPGDADRDASAPDGAPAERSDHGDGSLAHHALATLLGSFVPRIAFVALAEARLPADAAERAPVLRPRRLVAARAPPRSAIPGDSV